MTTTTRRDHGEAPKESRWKAHQVRLAESPQVDGEAEVEIWNEKPSLTTKTNSAQSDSMGTSTQSSGLSIAPSTRKLPTSFIENISSSRESFAADPEWWGQQDPYLYHTAQSVEGAQSILQHGLLPWDHASNSSKPANGRELSPRPNHTYMKNIFPDYARDRTVRIDTRTLDPQRINPDEDAFWYEPGWNKDTPGGIAARQGWPVSNPYDTWKQGPQESFGDWATRSNLTHPNHSRHSLEVHGTIAHDGPIPSEAISPIPSSPTRQSSVEEEPYFPTVQDANEANQAALAGFGQTNHSLLRPEVLEGALGRAQNYHYYENSMPKAAAALAHGVGQAQAYEDGNKRTAYWLTHHFLHENGLGHLTRDDDEELANHLVGYGEGTHNLEDTAAMFEQRALENSPKTSYNTQYGQEHGKERLLQEGSGGQALSMHGLPSGGESAEHEGSRGLSSLLDGPQGRVAAIHPEVGWMQENKPDWEHTGFNANQHPMYSWADAAGNNHAVTGFIGQGSNKAPINRIGNKLGTLTGHCENGSCNHIFSTRTTGEAPPDEIASVGAKASAQPYRIGQQVLHADQPHYVNDHAVIDGEHYYDLNHAQTGKSQEMVPSSEIESNEPRTSNILDPVHKGLDPRVWLDPEGSEPKLKPSHTHWIRRKVVDTLTTAGYDGMENWLSLVLTGSLTTYQYSDLSDVDISLFVDTHVFPEWSRAEMIGVMVENCDGTTLPGTPFPLQCFVVAPGIKREDLYKKGLRSGWDIDKNQWIVPPDRSRVHDVEKEMNADYTVALESADKMERLLRYEPDKAATFWHRIHKNRQRDQRAGLGDYSRSNIIYKFLANRGLFTALSDLTGEYLAKTASDLDQQRLDANAGQDLEGLPGRVNIPGVGKVQFHGHGGIQGLAQSYMDQAGLPYDRPSNYTKVNPQISTRIAQAYGEMQHAPEDPQVKESYGALARETKAQYDHAVKNGYQFEFYPEGHDPYPDSPRQAIMDLHHNKHMYVYPTHDGFGSSDDVPSDHPLLQDAGVTWGGKPVSHNDLFRCVHDFYGHAKEGLGFRADGEDNAWRQHAAMFSPAALPAMTAETRGQNSWVNYGPAGEHNKTAKQDTTVFAPQHAGMLPSWVMNRDLHDQPEPVTSHEHEHDEDEPLHEVNTHARRKRRKEDEEEDEEPRHSKTSSINEGDIDSYIRGLATSRERFPGFVVPRSREVYQANRVFTSPDAKQGVSLIDHGNGIHEIAGLYNNDEQAHGAGTAMLRHAAAQGGNYLECFDQDKANFSLPAHYHKTLGAMPTAWTPWNDQYAPEVWDHEKYGKPGHVIMTVPQDPNIDPEEFEKRMATLRGLDKQASKSDTLRNGMTLEENTEAWHDHERAVNEEAHRAKTERHPEQT